MRSGRRARCLRARAGVAAPLSRSPTVLAPTLLPASCRRRPFLASECDELGAALKWRRDVLREMARKISEIQNGAWCAAAAATFSVVAC